MKKNKLLFFLLLMIIATLSNSFAGSFTVTDLFYHYAQQRNVTGLKNLLHRGYSINTTNIQGDTPLCLALFNQDLPSYHLLKTFGANTNHPCVHEAKNQRPVQHGRYPQPKKHAKVYNQPSTGASWKSPILPYALGAAAIGSVVIAKSDNGKKSNKAAYWAFNNDTSGGDSGGDGGGDSGGDDEPEPIDPGSLTPVEASYFETSEYSAGHFLDKINASAAYARFYKLDKKGELFSDLKKISVGVLDSGVYANNRDFENTAISGFNLDFGPCRNENTGFCWSHDGTNTAMLKDNDGNVIVTITMSSIEYNEWKATYSEDYNWADNKYDYNPLPDIGESSNWHGTHVAGIIGADRNDNGMHGVAFSNAKIIAGRWDFMYPPAEGIINMVNKGANIINMSFGTASDYSASLVTDEYYNTNKDFFDNYIISGVNYAANNNVIMVMSAGNESKNQPGLYNGIPLLTDYHDALENLFVTVVATGNDGKIASYSNKCGVAQNYCIAAPGGDLTEPIISTGTYDNDTYAAMGTSMAAPVVSGSLALLMGAYPYMTPQQVVSLIFETANKEGEYADADTYGNGMLDLDAATTPQGELNTGRSNDVNSGMMNINASKIRVPAAFQEALSKNMPKTMVAFDKYKRPFKVSTSSMIQTTHSGEKNFRNDLFNFSRHQGKKEYNNENISFGYAPSAYKNNDSGLGIAEVSYKTDNKETSFAFSENTQYSSGSYVDKVLYNPYLAMNDAYSFAHKIRFDKMDFTLGFITGENGLYDGDKRYNDYNFDNHSYAFNAAASYQMTPELSLTSMIGNLTEDESLLGMNGTGSLAIGDSNTFYAGIMMAWNPNKSWGFSGAYYNGWTSPTDAINSMISTTKLLSNSFAFDGHYNFNETDKIGLQISSPLRIYSGSALFDIPTGRDNYSNAVYREIVRSHLKPSSREVKFALYHQQQIRKSILLKSELAMRLHPEHQEDAKTDYRAMLGLSWDM